MQVTKMLQIYQKARSVIAWLGPADHDTLTAALCVERAGELRHQVPGASKKYHSATCLIHLQNMLTALLKLYARPWLGRMWIRQEIFAARRIVAQCGPQCINWDNFVSGRSLLKCMQELLPRVRSELNDDCSAIPFLLKGAERNSPIFPADFKASRSFIEVLLKSRHFAVSKEQDVVYAVLGMCAVPTRTGAFIGSEIGVQRHSVLVDYSKTIAQVYQDATAYLLTDDQKLENLARLWHVYTRCPRHAQDLPSWAMDWRSSICDSKDPARIRALTSSMRRGSYLNPGFGNDHHNILPPKLSQSDTRVLEVQARVANYITYLSDYTCDLDAFSCKQSPLGLTSYGYQLGRTGRSIHSSNLPGLNLPLFKHLPENPILFEPGVHTRRIAILGSLKKRN